ncbi:MAG: twin-arginine translocase TatA/TatE family subunit [Candidatus Eisenbacteria bacterium]
MALSMLFGPLGATEILIIVLVLVLLFGARKIPELARGLGRGIGEFKEGLREERKENKPASPPAPESKQDQPRP